MKLITLKWGSDSVLGSPVVNDIVHHGLKYTIENVTEVYRNAVNPNDSTAASGRSLLGFFASSASATRDSNPANELVTE